MLRLAIRGLVSGLTIAFGAKLQLVGSDSKIEITNADGTDILTSLSLSDIKFMKTHEDRITALEAKVLELTPKVTKKNSCYSIWSADNSLPSGNYDITIASGENINVFCDMSGEGGWTLVEYGKAKGTILRTRSSVGTLTNINQASSAKLSRAATVDILLAGSKVVKFGWSTYGYLYFNPSVISDSMYKNGFVDSGKESVGYNTKPLANCVRSSFAGALYSGSRCSWHLDGMPSACLNTQGTGECSNGLHIGTWGGESADNVYVNHATCCNGVSSNNYAVWVR